jgi:hypothetical protein
MFNKILASSTVLAVVMGTTALTTVATAQDSIARMRFEWNFPEPGGAIYMNICTDPDFNIDRQSGGCAEINVLNEVVTSNRGGTKLVSDRLKRGTAYKACLVADNIYPNSEYSKRGRWITCKNFTAQDRGVVSFKYWDLQFVRSKP